jgi:probable F420-dependent oxidoreductase
VEIGVQFPSQFLVDDPVAIRDFAQAAEAVGYSHLLVYEHVVGVEHADRNPPVVVPYDEKTDFHEPLVLMGFLSAATTTIELTTGVLVTPQRQTALVAKQAAEVSILSGGRLRLGVGVGWNWVEYQALGQDFSTRGRRQEEQIELLRLLWSQPVVQFRSQWHRIERAGISPRPRSTIPIWIGGFSEAAYERAARVADGFIYSLIGTEGPEYDAKATVRHLQELVERAGRDVEAFGIEVLVPQALSPSEFGRLAEEWRPMGISHITLHLLPGQFSTTGEHLDALEIYMAAARS